ncbi:Uncharacterised protein [uncultured archaeon]|nr:Uncharacterised protein [uncultured archaeon]
MQPCYLNKEALSTYRSCVGAGIRVRGRGGEAAREGELEFQIALDSYREIKITFAPLTNSLNNTFNYKQ